MLLQVIRILNVQVHAILVKATIVEATFIFLVLMAEVAAAYGMVVSHTRVVYDMAVLHALEVYSSMAVLHTRVADNMADCYNTAACSNNLA
jgi:hypothetical protein